MRYFTLILLVLSLVSLGEAQTHYNGGGGTISAADTAFLSTRADSVSANTHGFLKSAVFADSARANGVGVGTMSRGQFVVAEGADTLGGHTFPVMLFFEFDSSFLSHYGTTGWGGPQYNGPDSLMLDSLRAILPNAANGDTVGYRLVWGMIPFSWSDSIGTTFSIQAYNNGTTWNTLGWATNSKVIPPYWSYMVKIVEKDGTPPGRSTLAIRARYRW